ncbi:MAG: hybrid sensor histidine kinase/response regulator [Magnetococcales bacterium]|nr:hybrid sensor histidine kinase/response regulator [Magnetococcales bacterium]
MSKETEKPKVLVVDDSPETLDMLINVLSGQYAVVPARDGESAFCKASKHPQPEIILLDIVMPGLDGFELCRRLKAQDSTRHIPIIFLTAVSDQESELNGLHLGAVDYIRKPISTPTMMARLSTHLELARSRKALSERNEVLEEVVRLREDIERITKHDLKGPLTSVIGFSEVVLEEGELSEYHQGCIESVIRAANRMLEMINRSLDLYKIETGRYQYEPKSFDIAQVIRRVCADLAPLAQRHSTAIVIVMPDHLGPDAACWLVADRTLCYFLLANLIKNAIEAAPLTTQVTVTLMEHADGWVAIAIHNHGMVPEAMQKQFFKKYETFGKEQGTGLGTYSAQLMARAQGGKVTMETSRELGTQVTVYLPQ